MEPSTSSKIDGAYDLPTGFREVTYTNPICLKLQFSRKSDWTHSYVMCQRLNSHPDRFQHQDSVSDLLAMKKRAK